MQDAHTARCEVCRPFPFSQNVHELDRSGRSLGCHILRRKVFAMVSPIFQ